MKSPVWGTEQASTESLDADKAAIGSCGRYLGARTAIIYPLVCFDQKSFTKNVSGRLIWWHHVDKSESGKKWDLEASVIQGVIKFFKHKK